MTCSPYLLDRVEFKENENNICIYQDTQVENIHNGNYWYSSIRKDYQRAVIVEWQNTVITTEPISTFVNTIEKRVCDKIIPIINNWKIAANEGITNANLCSFCCNLRMPSDHLCEICNKDLKWLDTLCNRGKKRNISEILENFESMEI